MVEKLVYFGFLNTLAVILERLGSEEGMDLSIERRTKYQIVALEMAIFVCQVKIESFVLFLEENEGESRRFFGNLVFMMRTGDQGVQLQVWTFG